MQVLAPGIYPRSRALVQATRDLDRGRTTQEAVDEQIAGDLSALVSHQQTVGFDLLSDGMLRWQDLFRPLVDACAGLEAGALTRFLDTNTFYRAPRRTGPLRLEARLDPLYVAPLPGPRLVTLPSPFAFAQAAGLKPGEIARGVLAPLLGQLDADLVVLSEPFLGRAERPDLDGLEDALGALGGGPPLALQVVFADAGPLLERLAAFPVVAIGIDFYATRLDAVPEGFPKQILAGVVDVRSSVVEQAEELAGFAARLAERTAGEVALCPNGDLQFVEERIARDKLSQLGQARAGLLGKAAHAT